MATKLRKGDHEITAHRANTVTQLKARGYTEVKARSRQVQPPTGKPESKGDDK